LTRDEIKALTLEEVRTRAAAEPVLGAWATLAADMEADNAGTVADLDPDAIERHYVATKSQYAELTPEKIARAMKTPDLSKRSRPREAGGDDDA
jgi:hypothetical protein